MSIRLITYIVIFMMLKHAIARLQHIEQNFNRREALVRTLVNAEKQAKTNQRIRFLLDCKRASVYPRFITNSVRNVSYMFKNSSTVEKRRQAFFRQLLNESIRDAFRTQAFRLREGKRLQQQVAYQQQQGVVDQMAREVYEAAERTSFATLKKKFLNICQSSNTAEAKDHSSHLEATAGDSHAEWNADEPARRCCRQTSEAANETDVNESARHHRHREVDVAVTDRLTPLDSSDQSQQEWWHDCHDGASLTQAPGIETGSLAAGAAWDLTNKDINQSARLHRRTGQAANETDAKESSRRLRHANTEIDEIDRLTPTESIDQSQEESWHDCQGDTRLTRASDIRTASLSAGDAWDSRSEGEMSFPLALNNLGKQVISTKGSLFVTATVGDELNPMLDDDDVDDEWYDCLSVVPFLTAEGQYGERRDGLGHALDRQHLNAVNGDDDDDIWYDCVLGYVGSVHADITGSCDPFDNRDRFMNMTGKVLSDQLVQILNKGPNFALSRSVNRHIMKDVEIGLERGAFALRWKEHIEKRKSLSGQHSPSSEDASDLAVTSNTVQSAPGETTDSDLLPDSTNPRVSLAPRFSDTDTRAAPTAGPRTEKKNN